MTREEAIDKLRDIADRESAWMEEIGVPDASQIGAFLLEVAEMLREQKPVEPHWRCPTVYMNGTGKIDLICGNCGISIPLGKPNYCPWCGRAVKWDA